MLIITNYWYFLICFLYKLGIRKLLVSISEIDFSEIYYQLGESNIVLNSVYQDYFKIIMDLKMQEYLEKEKIYKYWHL